MYHHHDVNPIRQHPRYQKLSVLGQGAFGFVFRAYDRQNQEDVAIKFLRRGEVTKYTEGEILNHSQLRHPHIIVFKDVFLTSEYICIVMEYASGGSLFNYVQEMRRLHEAVARWFFQQLIIGVDYCHRRGVVNRDIKLENTLLQEQTAPKLPLPLVKICDFGYAKNENNDPARSKVGTVAYMAPEVLENRTGAQYDGKKADVWSCGVMLYVMLFGKYPFGSASNYSNGDHLLVMLNQMKNMAFDIPEDADVSHECLSLLYRLLQPDPHQRASVEEITRDAWFRVNLPQDALTMNDSYVLHAETMPPPHPAEQILSILRAASRPGITEERAIENIIEAAIQEDFDTHSSRVRC